MQAGLSTHVATNCLGKYRLIAELGRGGMAEVFLAVVGGPGGFNKLVVIKRIRPQLSEDPEFLNMFLDEARLAARLNHPNIVQTNEVGQQDGQYYLAMEYLEGQPLNRVRTRLSRDGNLPLAMHLRVICEVLSGLHYAHELSDYDGTSLEVVHRDATPHNVFITYNGQVKLVDFGIAKALDSTAETRAGMLKGKVSYMAPEQARSQPVDRRADIFSVGVMLWEALAGRRLWKETPEVSVLKWLMDPGNRLLPSPRLYNEETPAILEAICMRALSPDRELRHATAQQLQRELESALETLPERHTVREAGALVSAAFAEERARIQAVVEEQVQAAQNLPTDGYQAVNLPMLSPVTITGTPSGATPSSSSQSVDQHSGVVATGGVQEPSSGSDPSHPSAQWSLAKSGASYTPAETSTGSVLSPTSSGPSKTWRAVVLLVVPLLVIAAGALTGIALTSGADPSDPSSSGSPLGETAAPAVSGSTQTDPPPATTTTEEERTDAAVAAIELTIAVEPAQARISVDDEPVEGNPYTGQVERDGEAHEIRAEADGYVAAIERVTFDQDRAIKLTLKKKKRPQAPATSTPPSDEPTPPTEPEDDEDWMKKRWPKAKRPIDDDNPYGR